LIFGKTFQLRLETSLNSINYTEKLCATANDS